MNDAMRGFATRLKAAVQRSGGPKAVSEAAGVPLSTLNTYLAGTAEPKVTIAVRLAQALAVPLVELLEGHDGHEDAGIGTAQPATQIRADAATIPVLDVYVSAGPGYENEAARGSEGLPFPRSLLRQLGVREKYARFMVARGDSMIPTIKDGDLVLVDSSFTRAKDEGVYVVVVGNGLRIKRIAFGWQGAINLLSDNEQYPPEKVEAPEAESLRVVGKVVWSGGQL